MRGRAQLGMLKKIFSASNIYVNDILYWNVKKVMNIHKQTNRKNSV